MNLKALCPSFTLAKMRWKIAAADAMAENVVDEKDGDSCFKTDPKRCYRTVPWGVSCVNVAMESSECEEPSQRMVNSGPSALAFPYFSWTCQCPSGRGGEMCAPCPAGHFASSSASDAGSKSNCIACTAGRFQSNTGQESCTSCALARYSVTPGAITEAVCVACEPGRFGDALRSQSSEQHCRTCPGGKFQQDAASGFCWAYNLCPVGKFLTAPGTEIADSACAACPVGKYSNARGSVSCKLCSASTCASGTR